MAVSSLRQWRNGEKFTARDYLYEREQIIAEVNRLAGLLTGSSDLTVNSITLGSKTRSYFGAEVFYDNDLPAEADRYVGLVYFDEE